MSKPETTVIVPRWALVFILEHGGSFNDAGPGDAEWRASEGWQSPEMERAMGALEEALEKQNGE